MHRTHLSRRAGTGTERPLYQRQVLVAGVDALGISLGLGQISLEDSKRSATLRIWLAIVAVSSVLPVNTSMDKPKSKHNIKNKQLFWWLHAKAKACINYFK
ncbi:MAG: hypothetical protein ACYCUV_05240 [Phycisphaerae bacterium]